MPNDQVAASVRKNPQAPRDTDELVQALTRGPEGFEHGTKSSSSSDFRDGPGLDEFMPAEAPTGRDVKVVDRKQKKRFKREDLGFKNSPLKSLLLRLQLPLTLAYCQLFKITRPVIVVLTVNNNCNWNCAYCYGDYPTKGTDKNLTTEQLMKVIDDLAELGNKYMIVHGGEALLRKDIGYLVDYIKTKGIYVGLVTNGQIFPKRIDEVRNVDSITFSLDGPKASNDRNRGEGTFDYTLTAIKLALKEKFKVRVQCTLTRHNKDDIEELAILAKEIGFPVSFSILFRTNFTDANADIGELNSAEIKECLTTIRALKRKGFPLFTSEANLKQALEWPYDKFNKLFLMKHEVPKDLKHVPCHYSKLKFHFEGEGYFTPCTVLSSNDMKSKSVLEVGVKASIEHVNKTNKCTACPHLTQNEWNLLMGMKPKVVAVNAWEQVKEIFRIY